MKYGAKNQLAGTVTKIKRGTVMSQVNLEIKTDASMSSVLTLEALDELGISEGDQVKVIVKAVNVLLIKE
jgi:molybdopterin-binding protein